MLDSTLSSILPALSPSDVKAVIAAIAWVLTSATRYGVDAAVLNAELQQLGLPRESADGLSRPYRIHASRLRVAAASDSLALPRALAVLVRADAVVATSAAGTLATPAAVVHVSLGLSHALSSRRARSQVTGDAGAPASQLHALHAARATLPTPGLLDTATAAAGDAAMASLGVSPLSPPAAQGSSNAASGESSTSASNNTLPMLPPADVVRFSASAEKAAALLAELKIAREVLLRVVAVTAPTPPT